MKKIIKLPALLSIKSANRIMFSANATKIQILSSRIFCMCKSTAEDNCDKEMNQTIHFKDFNTALRSLSQRSTPLS